MTKEEFIKKGGNEEVIELHNILLNEKKAAMKNLLNEIHSITIEIKQIEQDVLVKGKQIIDLMSLVKSLEEKFHFIGAGVFHKGIAMPSELVNEIIEF